MRTYLIRIAQIFVLLAVASSFAHADNFMYFKKKAAPAGGPPPGNSDSFTGADGTALATHDANWGTLDNTVCPIVGNAAILSNMLSPDTVWHSGGGRYTASSSDISQMVFKAVTSGSVIAKQVMVRANGTGAGYSTKFVTPSGGNWTVVGLYKNGVFAAQATGQTISQTADHTLRITASGTNPVLINVYVDGIQKITNYSDSSSPIGSGNPGFCVTGAGTQADNYMDDWQDY